MREKLLVCKGATVYCSKSLSNNNTGTAIPLNITSQKTVVVNGNKVVATDKDSTVANMNFGICNNGSVPPVPCSANVQWSKVYSGADVTTMGLKLLTEESQGVCSCAGGLVKIAFHGQIATPQNEEVTRVSLDVLSAILPVNPRKRKSEIALEYNQTLKNTAKVITIEILDDNNQPLVETLYQVVNLPKEQCFVNGTNIKGLYQLGTTFRCRVKFDGEGVNKFKLRVNPDINNVIYSEEEKKRNPSFKYQEDILELETDVNGEKIIEEDVIFLGTAGGNLYHLTAEDSLGNKVESIMILTIRKLYFTELKMKDLALITDNITTFTSEFKKQFIVLERWAEIIIPYIPNIDENEEEFARSVKAAFEKRNEMAPFCMAIAYTDHLAVKACNVPIVINRIKAGATVKLPVRVRVPYQQTLWYDLDGTDWFVECVFINTATKEVFNIDKARVTPVQTPNDIGIYELIDIDIEFLPQGWGRIELKINTVHRMRGGLFLGEKIIVICTRAWWRPSASATQNEMMIHELGHAIGMVPDGTGKSLDKPASYYDEAQGHVGPHCHSGIPVQADYTKSYSLATCVMYGSLNHNTAFCDTCAVCVKKLDLLNINPRLKIL